MPKTLICALALGAALLSPTFAFAKSGGSMSGGTHNGGGVSSRPQNVPSKPSVTFKKMKVMNCSQYPRGNGQGGVIMVTVCT